MVLGVLWGDLWGNWCWFVCVALLGCFTWVEIVLGYIGLLGF